MTGLSRAVLNTTLLWHTVLGPLGIDFGCILMRFGTQVGIENRAKSEKKSIEKRIEKLMKKNMRFGGPWGGELRACHGLGESWDPLITIKQRKPQTTAHRPQELLVTPCAHQRGGGYFIF